MIKVRDLEILRWEDYPGYSCWTNLVTGVLERREASQLCSEREGATEEWLEIEDGGQVAS